VVYSVADARLLLLHLI